MESYRLFSLPFFCTFCVWLLFAIKFVAISFTSMDLVYHIVLFIYVTNYLPFFGVLSNLDSESFSLQAGSLFPK